MNKQLLGAILGLIDSLYLELENNEMKDMFSLHRKNRDYVLDTVADIVLNYTVDDNVLSIDTKEKVLLKRELSGLVRDIAESEYQNEKAIYQELLETSATERYLINSYFYSRAFNINYSLKKLSDKEIRKVINAKVDSKIWSDRLWKHKKGLERTLRKELYDLVDGKTNINKISREISKRYSQSYSRSRTLARTEGTRVQSEINETWAEKHNVEEMLFIATLDNKTSSICQSLDGNVYEREDTSRPKIPNDTHPNCRSTYVNVPFRDWRPTVRRDNITKQNVNYSTYKEWKNKQ